MKSMNITREYCKIFNGTSCEGGLYSENSHEEDRRKVRFNDSYTIRERTLSDSFLESQGNYTLRERTISLPPKEREEISFALYGRKSVENSTLIDISKLWCSTEQQDESYPESNRNSESYPESNRNSESYPESNRNSESYPESNQNSESYPESKSVTSHNATYSIESTCNFRTMILEDDSNNNEVSIVSTLVNLILTIHSKWEKLLSFSDTDTTTGDEILMAAAYSMKTLKDLTSQLCCVHEAVALLDLKLLSCALKDEVNTSWEYIKVLTLQIETDQYTDIDFKYKILRMLELASGLSLASVDHMRQSADDLYISEKFKGELTEYFVAHQHRFLLTMVDEAICTVEKGIEQVKQFQLASSHHMSEDLVDGIMNVLTSLVSLFFQFQDFTTAYSETTLKCSGLYFTQECLFLRSMLTDIVNYNEYATSLIEKSKCIVEGSETLAEFLPIVVMLVDITKCICNGSGYLLAFVSLNKSLDEATVDTLYESHEKFIFCGKTVRVGVTMLVQEVELELGVGDNHSVIPIIQSDETFVKKATLCPMNVSVLNGAHLQCDVDKLV